MGVRECDNGRGCVTHELKIELALSVLMNMDFYEQLASCFRSVFGRFGVELFVIFLVAFQCLGFIGT